MIIYLDSWKRVGISTDMTAYQWSLVAQLKWQLDQIQVIIAGLFCIKIGHCILD